MQYKVSYVIPGQPQLGLIRNEDHLPQIGERITMAGQSFVITEVIELIPPRGDWGYYHCTCMPAAGSSAT